MLLLFKDCMGRSACERPSLTIGMKKIIIIICVLSLMASNVYAEGNMSGKVFMEGELLDGDLIKISVRADEIQEEVLGIAFNLLYEKEKLQFVRYLPGDFLELGGDPFYLVKNESDRIVFGETLRRNDYFPSGSGEVVQFYFQIKDGENFSFSFERGVLSTFDEIRQDLINIFWEPFQMSKNDGLIFSTKTNVLESDLGASYITLFRVGIFVLSSILGVFAVIFLKKWQSKRVNSSVNFNSGILD